MVWSLNGHSMYLMQQHLPYHMCCRAVVDAAVSAHHTTWNDTSLQDITQTETAFVFKSNEGESLFLTHTLIAQALVLNKVVGGTHDFNIRWQSSIAHLTRFETFCSADTMSHHIATCGSFCTIQAQMCYRTTQRCCILSTCRQTSSVPFCKLATTLQPCIQRTRSP